MRRPNSITVLILSAGIMLVNTGFLAATETIERIYAIVNDQIITLSEMKNSELQLTNMLSQQYQGDELKAEIEKMKSTLLDTMIQQKLLLSKAKEKKYDIAFQIDAVIKQIKKDNNIVSDEELRKALTGQGVDYETWREQITQQQLQSQLIYEEIGSKITIDNSQIMAYYREHQKDFTVPLTFTLDAIYLPLSEDSNSIQTQRAEIDAALEKREPFSEVAKKFSQLSGEEDKTRLGTFKSGELSPMLEDRAKELTLAQSVSPWIETDNGWYRLNLVERVDEHLKEYKDVRTQIENSLKAQIQEEKVKTYIEELKRISYIKIIE